VTSYLTGYLTALYSCIMYVTWLMR